MAEHNHATEDAIDNDDEQQPEPAADTAHEEAQGLPGERVEELVDLARSGDADLPVGAEDFAEALRIVAAERDDLNQRLLRTAADYQNFQRRASNNEREARELARAGVVQSLIQVLDFFDMATKQNPETATVEQVIGGVQMIKSEMVRVLGLHGVAAIEPSAGDAFDPMRHEAIEQRPTEGAEPGSVLELRSPGYSLGDRVVRPAKVVVATTPATQDAGDAAEAKE